jgi:hypothetical protein
MAKRKSISKRVRFEVFKRDAFTCQYCGSHPPKVILHVDHIVPVAEGGLNEDDNLVTACDGCNLGKGARPLTDIPKSLAVKAEEIAEREEQIRGYSAIMAAKREREEQECWMVAEVFMDQFCKPDDRRIRRDWFRSIKRFIEQLGVYDVVDAMERAVFRVPHDQGHCFRYFCGICWKTIKGNS